MKPKFFRKILANGMTILFEKREFPVVSVAIAVKTGGMHENEQEKGISHFIEHMLYKGTKIRTYRQISEEIENNGGELNGFTNETATAYWCKMPSRHLNIALDVLTDMVKNSVFDAKELEKERKVIFEEIKMRKDSPRTYVADKIHGFLYEKPFGIDVIGTYESMNSITREKIVKRFKEIYRPNNMILAVVGDADFSEIVKFAEKNFGKGRGILPEFEIKEKNETKAEKRKGIDQANLIFAFHSPKSSDKKSYAAMILNTLMASGSSSRLFQEIREKRNLAYAIHGNVDVNKEFSYSIIYAGTTVDKVDEVKRLIIEEFQKVSREITEKELSKAKDNLIGNLQISVEDSQGQLIELIGWEIANGNASSFYDFEKNIRKVTLDEVKELAKIKDYSFFVLVPE